MYQSPIELIEKEIHTDLEKQVNDHILQTIKEMGIHVDKEELIKALIYDREQYYKGYFDAKSEIIRCKDCKFRNVNEHYGEPGYMNLKAMCDLDTGDIFELGRNAEDDEWYCADAKRKEG